VKENERNISSHSYSGEREGENDRKEKIKFIQRQFHVFSYLNKNKASMSSKSF
jgi:hypothetical protein